MQLHTDPVSGHPYVVDPVTGESRWAPASAGVSTAVLPPQVQVQAQPWWQGQVQGQGQNYSAASPYAAAPGYADPGYAASGYAASGYAASGYGSPGHAASGNAPVAVSIDDRQNPYAYLALPEAEVAPPGGRVRSLAAGNRAALWVAGGAVALMVAGAVALVGPDTQQPVPLPVVESIAGPSVTPSGAAVPARSAVPTAPARVRARHTSAPAPVAPSVTRRVAASPTTSPTPAPTPAPTSASTPPRAQQPTRAQQPAPPPSATPAPPVEVVRSGAFCSAVGSRAVTANGQPMVCSASNAFGIPYPNGRPRWRVG